MVKTGAQYTSIDGPTHVKGIAEGNALGKYEQMAGHNPDGTSTTVRSTGVAATEPIDSSMPNLSPA
jgi:hypothetical protein